MHTSLQDDLPLPDEDMVDGPPADEDSRVHSEANDSDNEVMQEHARTDAEDENEDEDGEDLLENMEGYEGLMASLKYCCSHPFNA